ncbi:MAG: hypothetical protein MJ071_03335 [Oscillospiraceae bacterium]|nr:hypothetical protein [Oscillospiraceae bacterium]
MLNLRQWRRSPQIFLGFSLGWIACFLLTDKTIQFADTHDTVLQVFEPFIWTFGDGKSILLISLCLLLIFSDMPYLHNETAFYLVRTTRLRWMWGQVLYLILTTLLFMAFILLSACMLAGGKAFPGNQWSDTAAILSYSEIGTSIAVPAYVKVLEFSYPYQVTLHIFGLMLCYTMVLAALIFLGNLIRPRLGTILGILFSGIGLLVQPEFLVEWLRLREERAWYASVWSGWLSPLNHAAYASHSFGYDHLPTLQASYLLFGIVACVLLAAAFWQSKQFVFQFTGTER